MADWPYTDMKAHGITVIIDWDSAVKLSPNMFKKSKIDKNNFLVQRDHRGTCIKVLKTGMINLNCYLPIPTVSEILGKDTSYSYAWLTVSADRFMYSGFNRQARIVELCIYDGDKKAGQILKHPYRSLKAYKDDQNIPVNQKYGWYIMALENTWYGLLIGMTIWFNISGESMLIRDGGIRFALPP